MTEAELHKGGVYVWLKGDPKYQATLLVTQVTRRMVRAVTLINGKRRGGSFWNPKCIFTEACSPEGERDE